jgi:hypothetical protein
MNLDACLFTALFIGLALVLRAMYVEVKKWR